MSRNKQDRTPGKWAAHYFSVDHNQPLGLSKLHSIRTARRAPKRQDTYERLPPSPRVFRRKDPGSDNGGGGII